MVTPLTPNCSSSQRISLATSDRTRGRLGWTGYGTARRNVSEWVRRLRRRGPVVCFDGSRPSNSNDHLLKETVRQVCQCFKPPFRVRRELRL